MLRVYNGEDQLVGEVTELSDGTWQAWSAEGEPVELPYRKAGPAIEALANGEWVRWEVEA